MPLIDPSDRPSPRCTVLYEDGASSWSAFYGAIPLGRFATVSSAWDAIDRAATSRAALVPAVPAVADVRDADADEPEEEPRAGGGPDDRPGRSRYRGARSPAAREHRRRRWRERRAPVSAANHIGSD